jgi:aryl sulfotransferase
MKTHLALDGIPYNEKVKYVVVCRDGRDIAMSFWNHYSNYSEGALARLQARSPELGREFPVAPAELNTFWHDWSTRGWFDWQQDGWPMWSELHVMQSWFDFRHLPNIPFFHYADMLADTPRAIREIADFLGIAIDDGRANAIAEIVSFDNMKANSDKFLSSGGRLWVGGGDTFFNKGTNGRWRDEISAENLALYDQAADRVMSPECRRWTETGGPLP